MVSLRSPVLPLPARCSGVRSGVALRAALPPVLPRATVVPAARFPLGTTLRPVSFRTTLLPAASAAVLRAAALPGALPAAPGGRPTGTRTLSVRTALLGAAAAPAGSPSAGTAGASSR
jgi:hypothetical protein